MTHELPQEKELRVQYSTSLTFLNPVWSSSKPWLKAAPTEILPSQILMNSQAKHYSEDIRSDQPRQILLERRFYQSQKHCAPTFASS
ncbi:hypothetical protein Y032_0292g1581 [Ancylostoma ceylanicum]|uniref:Uncharacterized protein n=1 Tax=Ancylostoma ceylanicum TaxID=53326 RepID=A0A016S5G5_9BILA|nr:hypothetical protein Y032_0292g1581 [Ancylostoma ceylanicum]